MDRIVRLQMMGFFIKILFFPIFHIVLKPLILRNYLLREISAISRSLGIAPQTPNGKDYPDEWYWADTLAAKYGYFVDTCNLKESNL